MPTDRASCLTLPEVADRLGVPVSRVHQFLRDGQLVAWRTANGELLVPADLLSNGSIVKGLPGIVMLLRDARFDDAEILGWLGRGDDSLPGTPLEALRANRGREVARRAQVAGY